MCQTCHATGAPASPRAGASGFVWGRSRRRVSAMRTLGQPNAQWAGDTGQPDAALRVSLAAAYSDEDAYARAVAALCTARLLLPIVATGDESGDGPDPDRHAEMAAVLLEAPDGRTAVVAFTGLDSLQGWNPEARPVPCTVDQVAATAVETGSTAVLVDPGGPHPVVLDGSVMTELANGHRLVELPDAGFGWMYLGDDSPSGDATG